MKKILKVSIPICLWLLFLTGCTTNNTPTEYKTEAGGFIVNFLGVPQEEKKAVDTAMGSIDMNIYSVSKDDIAYVISTNDYPEQFVKSKNTKDILNDSRDGILSNTKGKLLYESDIQLEQFPGKELKYEVAEGAGITRQRIFLVNQRLYQISVSTGSEEKYSKEINNFFDSFKLINN